MTVSVTTLKARLSEILRSVKAGSEVIVTEHGRAVARLSPLAESPERSARLQELVDAGVVRPGRGQLPEDFFTAALPKDETGGALEALLDERASGR